MRNEGKKKQGRLRVENFGEDSLTKSARRLYLRCVNDHLRISRANHSHTQPNKIGGTCVFDGVKRNGRRGKDCRDAKGGGENMEDPPTKVPKEERTPSRRPPARLRAKT